MKPDPDKKPTSREGRPLGESIVEPCASSSSRISASSSGEPELLDLRGESCPYTFVYTRLRLEKMAIGARLAVLVDHEPATRNIPRSARQWGQAIECVEPLVSRDDTDQAHEGQSAWRIVIEKRVP